MNRLRETVSGSILFKDLPDHYLDAILKIGVEKEVLRGGLIFSEGEPGDGIYIVISGQVKVFKLSMEGKEKILHMFGPGEPFGEVPVFSGKVYPAAAEATRNSRLLFIPRSKFIELITADPGLALNMLAVLSRRLRGFTTQIENLALKEVPNRLAGYLILMAGEQQNPEMVELHISKGQLASFLGTIPETLSRILKKMTDQGLIEVEGRKIRLTDYDGLTRLAESSRLEDMEN